MERHVCSYVTLDTVPKTLDTVAKHLAQFRDASPGVHDFWVRAAPRIKQTAEENVVNQIN